ncbi:MAG: ABC transporter ATP-binding protein, partial [Finegoldia magna]|nr:ABC transporter ATP-binding protein [Finegoldia magna]
MLKLEKIRKSFKNNLVLKDVSFTVDTGEVVGLVGLNGSGKSTIIRIISGLIIQDNGTIENDFKNIGVLLEGSRNIYHFLTVRENIKYFSILNNIEDAYVENFMNKYITLFGLEDKLDEEVGNLSRGMIQKVSIMILLAQNPDIIIMDEPTLGLDIISTIQIREIIQDIVKEKNKTVLIVSHDTKLLDSVADRILFLKDGKIEADIEKENLKLNKDSEYLVYYYGMEDGLENIYYEKNIYKTITKEPKQVMEILGDRLIKAEILMLYGELKHYYFNYIFYNLGIVIFFIGIIKNFDFKDNVILQIVSLITWHIITSSISYLCNVIQDEAVMGTLEQLFLSKANILKIFLSKVIVNVMFTLAKSIILFCICLLVFHKNIDTKITFYFIIITL